MVEAFLQGAVTLLQPDAFLMLLLGVGIGTIVAVSPPGLGTPLAYAMLIPFAITMDPVLAIALLLGMDTVTATGNTFLPVLLGVPGGASGQASILDGYPLGRKGQAKYALGAGFTASMMAGLFSVGIWLLAIQLFRPVLYYIGSPELFLLVLWGLSMVAVLAGPRPVKGLIALCLGLLLSSVGTEPHAGVDRYMLGLPYFLDGIHISIVALGLFGVPAALDLVVRKMGVEQRAAPLVGSLWDGVKVTFQHWGLVLRSSVIGVWVGFTPGLGGQVADWIAYGFAAQTCKGAQETFGKGDIRGVIAPDSCNSSTDAGALIPTTLLGVPGSLTKAFFMGALIMMGITPGPDLIEKHLDLVMVMIWVNVYGTIIGGLVCMLLIRPLAQLAVLRYTILVPVIIIFGFVGSFTVTRDVIDLILFIVFGFMGVVMKRYGVPRPPLVMGFLLAPLLEKYLYISTLRYGVSWLIRPQVLILLPLIVGLFAWTIWSGRRRHQNFYVSQGDSST
jgi:putative tricarboxylic transport membrane protein